MDVLTATADLAVPYFKPGEFEALVNDTIGQWILWTGSSRLVKVGRGLEIYEVSASLHRAEMEGVTEVVTGRARAEYQWSKLDNEWRRSYIDPLKKAVGVYLEHNGIKGVPKGQMVDPARVLDSRFVLTNKGGPTLSDAELKARWIFGGHKDPDAGLYDTSSPTASILGHNLINFVAVQEKWVVHFEDVSAAFLQTKELPRKERIYVKVPKGYPPEVIDYLVAELGDDVRDDLVELTKGGFGLPESPRLWYLEYKDTIQDLGLMEMSLLPGVFRAFHPPPRRRVRALASIHVDDTRYAGDETAQEIWDQLRMRLKFGKQRKATDGWVKFCGRWERQDPETLEMEYSMEEYTKAIPFARVRPSTTTSSASTASTPASTTASPRSGPSSAPTASTTTPTASSTTLPAEEKGPGHSEWMSEPIAGDSDLHVGLPAGTSGAAPRQRGTVDGGGEESDQFDCWTVAGRSARTIRPLLRESSERGTFKVRNLGCPLDELVVISVSDAAYGAMPGGHSQGGNLVMVAHPSAECSSRPRTGVHLGGEQHESAPCGEVLYVGRDFFPGHGL